MSNSFNDIYEFMENYLEALESGASKAIAVTPLLIRQEFAAQARRNLKTSFSEYMAALDIRLNDSILVVELDGSWLAQAVEDGVSEFDMKETILKSPKAKTSKRGFKYMSIPLPVSKSTPNAGTDKALALQEKIKEALNDPIFFNAKMTKTPDGALKKMEQLVTSDPALKGMYRIQGYKNKEDFADNKPMFSQYMMFRTISNNPFSKSKWQHPGIQSRKLFPRVSHWANSALSDVMSDIISEHMTDFLSGKGS